MDKQYHKIMSDFRMCKYCQHWNKQGRRTGECRRRAPTKEKTSTVFPMTTDTCWCGEFTMEPKRVEDDNAPQGTAKK